MIHDTMGIIYTGDKSSRMQDLTRLRSIAAVPVGGRYRIIDFLLSGMVNSGIRNIGVITEQNYHSLMDHLGSGKEWDLHSKRGGLFLLPPFMQGGGGGVSKGGEKVYTDMLDALRSNLGYLRRSQEKYVLVTKAQHVHVIDYTPVMQAHVSTGADITVLYHRYSDNDIDPNISDHTFVDVKRDGQIRDMELNPRTPSYAYITAGAFIIERQLLYTLLDNAHAHGYTDFIRDILMRGVQDNHLRIFGHEIKSYVRRIESVQSFYDFNMDLLDEETRREIFGQYPIYTKVRDDVPVIYGKHAHCANSLLADGCVIEGSVENSVLFRGVYIAKGAVVRNSIIMQDAEVQENAEVENIIADKQVVIKRARRIISSSNFPIVIAKDSII